MSWWCRTQFEVLFLIHDLLKPWIPQPRSRSNGALDESATVDYFPDIVDLDVGREGEEVGFPICAGVTN